MARRYIGLLNTYFYFFMSLLITVVVVFGFSHTIGSNLLHPAIARPFILYVHAVVFFGWLGFFILQSLLIRTRNGRLHRRVGWFGVALGATIMVLGTSTAITMARFRMNSVHVSTAPSTLVIPLFDMLAFSVTFALGIYLRRKPEYHRRLILVACCALTAAAFGRFPPSILPPVIFYAGVDLLILLGVVRDLLVQQRVHRVYLFVLPLFIVGQTTAMYIAMHAVTPWLRIAHVLVR